MNRKYGINLFYILGNKASVYKFFIGDIIFILIENLMNS